MVMARNDAQMLVVPDPVAVLLACGSKEAPAVQQVTELEFCPNCGVRITALDLKMNHCFKCNKVLNANRGAPNAQRLDTLGLK
jgi:hypothetical protein